MYLQRWPLTGCPVYTALSYVWGDQNDRRPVTLDILWSTVDLRATDPRDKIYAILGIARERDQIAFLPDYSSENTFLVALQKVVRDHLAVEKNLHILCYFLTLYREAKFLCHG